MPRFSAEEDGSSASSEKANPCSLTGEASAASLNLGEHNGIEPRQTRIKNSNFLHNIDDVNCSCINYGAHGDGVDMTNFNGKKYVSSKEKNEDGRSKPTCQLNFTKSRSESTAELSLRHQDPAAQELDSVPETVEGDDSKRQKGKLIKKVGELGAGLMSSDGFYKRPSRVLEVSQKLDNSSGQHCKRRVWQGIHGDSSIENMNRLLLEKIDRGTAEEIWEVGKWLGFVVKGDENVLVERLKSMELKDRVVWEKNA
ncbi:hypothetical protein Ancab_011582 [Ancistrocladus abbreviatus]